MLAQVLRLSPVAVGVILLFLSTLAGSLADGTIKDLSARIDAPQVFFLSGLVMAGLCLLAARAGDAVGLFTTTCLTTRAPKLLALRSAATVVSAMGFFYALSSIPLAEVFLFVGIMPMMSALMSRALLDEPVTQAAWLGLVLGAVGLALLFPAGLPDVSFGHLAGMAGALAGTLSLVLSRKMARVENNSLVQVFYPNLALAVTSLVLLPAIWVPMGWADIGLILVYSALLFLARWTMVQVMARLAAPVALPLMNVQFVWLVATGWLFFGEVPQLATVAGAVLVIAAGVIALTQQGRIARLAAMARAPKDTAIPAE